MQEEVSLQRPFDSRLTRRLLALILPWWPWVLVALVCLLANSALQILSPLLVKIAIDRYLAPGGGTTLPWLEQRLPAEPIAGLAHITLLYFGILAAGLLLDFSQQLIMQRTGQHAMFALRRRILARLHELDLRFFDTNPVGRLVTRVTSDVDALNELFASGLVSLLGDTLVLVFILLAMFRLSPALTLLMLLALPAVFLVTWLFRRAVQESNRRIRAAVARINSFLQEHISGISVLQLYNREARAARDFAAVNAAHRDAYFDSIRAYGWFYPSIEFISVLTIAALLVAGGWQVRGGALSLGVLVAFFQYAMRVFRPIQDLSERYNILQSALAAAERIFQLLDTPAQIQPPARPRPFPDSIAPIEFDQVWFAYKDGEWVLRDVSFRIEPGEVIAVVGHTGAGKTTLTNLLMRFYDVQRGAIRIGGIDIREFDPRELRRHFGVVLQDPTLFTGTIADNIRLGSLHVTEDAIEMAADQVNLLEFIEQLPSGFDHPVRERGAGLSTGQKQLISFARALAHNPRYLILDEATSSVDTETELRVREALEKMVEGRTSIIIAHRLSTIQRADRIFVMHKGQLREVGTHQELLARRGIYWKLYQLQYKDQEIRR
ncbi:MAG: ABC transporter ATP-binding protein/permease [Bryobacteraceae bacterium]|nr:ABC transporter ATP-binding protein/permease [Bryobacteraceae bacterium]MCX7604022.1 ABC transporter ATP-binding protein/permease [Bryobacteraceae bacterium]